MLSGTVLTLPPFFGLLGRESNRKQLAATTMRTIFMLSVRVEDAAHVFLR